MDFKSQINSAKLPAHIAIIMDGNGRWAQQRGMKRIWGHQNGVKAVRETAEAAAEIGIQYLTLYSFSKENWNRPEEEVNALMSLLVETINSEMRTLMDNDIRLRVIGNMNSFRSDVTENLNKAIDKTSSNERMDLVLALNYSAEWEITEAAQQLAQKVKNQEYEPEDITKEVFANHLTTAGMDDPELLIRTGGEQRVSNFLLWQISYAELYFTDVLWPDFRKADFYKSLVEFQSRRRKFGKTSEQIENEDY